MVLSFGAHVHYVGAILGTTPPALWATSGQPATHAFVAESRSKAVPWREDPANYGPIPRP